MRAQDPFEWPAFLHQWVGLILRVLKNFCSQIQKVYRCFSLLPPGFSSELGFQLSMTLPALGVDLYDEAPLVP